MSLVSAKDMAKAIGVDSWGWAGNFIGWILLHLLRLNKLNKFYEKHKHLQGKEFLDAIIEDIQARLIIPEDDLKRIPEKGAFITVSNHPLGGLDGILLMKLLLDKRSDFKVLSNFLLQRIEPIREFLLPVNPFEELNNRQSSFTGLKKSLEHLSKGHPLGLFPAGEVSTFKEGSIYVDKDWNESMLKLIYKADVPVIPIYFHAKNSRIFYWLSKINPVLRTARLPSELLNKRRTHIHVRIGNPVMPKEKKNFKNHMEFGEYIRKKTYLLSKPFERPTENKSFFKWFKKNERKIIDPVPVEKLITEIEKLRRQKNKKLLSRGHYEVFLADADEIPNILREISRLREITFRKIGEGTGKHLDLDKYDKYYKHLFLWDNDAKKIVGAYRIGIGSEIYKTKGVDGFYIASLFKFEPESHYLLKNALELGRAFIVPEYQLKPYPLFLLWQGILYTILHYPNHKYLIGGVSISDKFSDFTKSLMIEFMKSHYYDPFLANYIRPRKEFKVKIKDADKDFIFEETHNDLNKLDKIIDELEPNYLRLPVLIKQYIKQNAKIIAFNVDPDFNNSIDALMYIRIVDIPEKTIKPIIEEYEKQFNP